MRCLFFLIVAWAIAACSSEAPGQADANAAPPLQGRFIASSQSAQAVTGDISIERGGVLSSRGVVLYTRVLMPRHGGDLVSRSGDSYAAIAVGPADLAVELRRIIEQAAPAGVQGLCGDTTPTYVAFAHDERATQVTMVVFSGPEPPGPEALESRLCGAFAYEAPDGARTRQGVLLW